MKPRLVPLTAPTAKPSARKIANICGKGEECKERKQRKGGKRKKKKGKKRKATLY